MNKFHFIFDKTKRTQNLKKIFKKYRNYSLKKSTIIVVAGGDGFMLRILKKFYKYKKPFYGINCGTIGFLMNKLFFTNLENRIKQTKSFIINPIESNIITTNKKLFKTIAINEISLLRQSKQTAILNLQINHKNLIKKLISDGVLVSTPAGSTAYNLSVNGPILSLNSKKIAVTPISPFRPRRLRGKIISDKSVVTITNLEPEKRPVSAVADNNEFRNIKKIKIKVNKNKKIRLLFNKGSSLIKKIKEEQRKKIK
tara:strand:- start:227 stop:991 length:765 start_codon:yes stop_codon:yes gene_type:complete